MTPEIWAAVNAESKVLDLGSGPGSFPNSLCTGFVVRCDIEFQLGGGTRVRASAESLPFGPLTFDLIVSSHSLEHFSRPDAAIGEIGRVIKKSGGVFVAVPDGGSLSDRLSCWVASGGGHLNRFNDPVQLGREISDATGLSVNHIETLNSGFTFLNPRNCAGRPWGSYCSLRAEARQCCVSLPFSSAVRIEFLTPGFPSTDGHCISDPRRRNQAKRDRMSAFTAVRRIRLRGSCPPAPYADPCGSDPTIARFAVAQIFGPTTSPRRQTIDARLRNV